MTTPDANKLLLENVAKLGQAEVGRRLGYSAASINTIVKGVCPNPEHVLKRVVEVFGGLSVDCPVLGEMPLSRCADERKKPFAAVNHQAVALWKACQSCERNA